MPHDDDIRNDADFLERIEKLQRDNTVQFLRLLQDAKSPPSGSGKRGGDLLFDLARLSLRSYEQWIKLSAHGLERVADSMCLDPEGRACDPPAKSTPRVPLRMTARPGDVTGASFVVENPYDQAAVVRFTTPALKTSDGKTSLPGRMWLRQSHVHRHEGEEPVLEPGKSARLELVIEVGLGAEDGRYLGESYVLVRDRVVGLLAVEVSVAPSTQTASHSMRIDKGQSKELAFRLTNPFQSTAPLRSLPLVLCSDAATLDVEMPAAADVPPGTTELKLTVRVADTAASGKYQGETYCLIRDRVALHLKLEVTVP